MISYRQADIKDKLKQLEPIEVGDVVKLSPEGERHMEELIKVNPNAVVLHRSLGTVNYSHNGQLYIRWPGSHQDEQWQRKFVEIARPLRVRQVG